MKKIYLVALANILSPGIFAAPGLSPASSAGVAEGKLPLAHRTKENSFRSHSVVGRPYISTRSASEEEEAAPIFNVEGKSGLYDRCVYGTYIDSGFITMYYGKRDVGRIVEGTDGNLYVKDICPITDFMSYTRLEPCGEGKYVVKTPQRLFNDVYDDVELYYDLMVMDRYVDPDDGSTIYVPSEDTSEATFTMDAEGRLIFDTPYRYDEEQQDRGLAERVLGVQLSYYMDGEYVSGWSGNAIFTSIYTPSDEIPNADILPDRMTTEKWDLVYLNEGFKSGHKVPVGFNGDEMWIGNLYDGADLWIKGKVEADKVTFTGPQFMNTFYEFFMYFMPGHYLKRAYPDSDEYYDSFEYTDGLVMHFDAENKVLYVDDPEEYMVLTWDLDVRGAATLFENPYLNFPAGPSGIPSTPEHFFYEVEYDSGTDSWVFFVNNVSSTNYIFDDDDLFFRFYVNDEDYIFKTEAYQRLPYDMTEIPYICNDGWDIFTSGMQRVFAIYTWNLPVDIETISVKLCFRNPDTGEVLESLPLTYDVINENIVNNARGITIGGDKETENIIYYDFSGNRVDESAKGFIIKKTVFTDGTSLSEKIVR